MPEDQPVVLTSPKPFLSELISNPKFKFLIFGIILLCLITAVFYFLPLSSNQPKILAYVNNESISEKFLKDKIASGCLVQKSDNQSQALDKWIDFIVLKKGAQDLGINVTLEEVRQKVDEKGVPRIKTCPEEFQSYILKNRIRSAVLPQRTVAHLVTLPDKKTDLERLVKNYDHKKYKDLGDAANKLFTSEKTASPSAVHYALYLDIAPDTKPQGLYKDPKLLQTVLSLREGEISKVLTIDDGTNQNKLAVVEVIKIQQGKNYQSFEQWFTEAKKRSNIRILP